MRRLWMWCGLRWRSFFEEPFSKSPRSPIVAVSSLTGAGLENLKQAIVAAVDGAELRDAEALARLPIDRVFTMKGFGTVVTGTLISGTIRREDELEVFPTGQRVRVRGIQVHGETADAAIAGQRTALNLAGASTEELSRGMILAPPQVFATTRTIDVHLRLLSSAPHPLKKRAKVRFHAHSMEAIGEVVFQPSISLNPNLVRKVDTLQMEPGSEAFARIRLPEPVLLLPGIALSSANFRLW